MEYYIVDAFTDRMFHGGQAGVCILDRWPEDAVMQDIAAEFNVSDTSFLIKRDGYYDLRWFMPGGELNLVGHATLGAAYALFRFVEKDADRIEFHTESGVLTAKRRGDAVELDFPAIIVEPYELRQDMIDALGGSVPSEVYKGRDFVFMFKDAREVAAVEPNYAKMKALPEGLGVFVTAPGIDTDLVARAFWPKMGINEDPVCGSMHCNLTPLWAKKLHKNMLTSHQLSPRGGWLELEWAGDRVLLRGKSVLSATGTMYVPGLD